MAEPILVHAPAIPGHEYRGRVTLADFWDYTCVNCLRTLPYLLEWDRRYRAAGLQILGIHTPEFSFAREEALVRGAAAEFGIAYPLVLDNDRALWRAFANRHWPSEYLIDTEGYIRYAHAGEGAYEETERRIQELLRERHARIELPPLMEPLRPIDRPEVFAACERPTRELYLADRPTEIELQGDWSLTDEYAEAGNAARLRLPYSAAEVDVVAAGEGAIDVLDNGKPVDHQSRGSDLREAGDGRTFLPLDRPRLYAVLRRDRFLSRTMEMTAPPGARVYTFTFGGCVPRP